MEKWVDLTAMLVDSREQADLQAKTEDIAYEVYKKHTLHGELLAAIPLSENSRAALKAILDRNLKEVGEEHRTSWVPQSHGRAHYAYTKDRRVARATAKQHKLLKREGMGYRFSLTCTALMAQTDDGASLSTQRVQSIGRSHRAMLCAAATWSNSEPTAIGGKAMIPERALTINDHGVLYGRGKLTPAETKQKAAQYSVILDQPSRDHVPLGMEAAADGVAYAELHQARRDHLGRTHWPPGYNRGDSRGSYGCDRGRVVAEAIERAQRRRDTGESLRQRAIEELDGALQHYGYDRGNPARGASTKRVSLIDALKKFFGRC